MNQYKKTGRIVGVLFLLVFIIGVTMYQFLQTSLFDKDFLTKTFSASNKIILSTILGVVSGLITITISILLFPIFKRVNLSLAYTYITFCIVSMITMLIDNISVLSLLELSKEYVSSNSKNNDFLRITGILLYERHSWTHYIHLFISCFPVFVFYFTLYLGKLVPRIISISGMMAAVLMCIEMLSSIFGYNLSMNMLLPMAIIQITLPIWLIFKCIKSENL